MQNMLSFIFYESQSDFEWIQVLTTSLVGNTLVLWTVLAHRRFDLHDLFCSYLKRMLSISWD